MVFGLGRWHSSKTRGRIRGFSKKIDAKDNILLYHIKHLLGRAILMNYAQDYQEKLTTIFGVSFNGLLAFRV